MEERTLLLRINNNDYFFRYLSSSKVQPYYKSHLSYIERIARKILTSLNIPSPFAYDEWKYSVTSANRIILFDFGYDKLVSKYIKKKNNSCIVHYFAFNKLKPEIVEQVRKDKNIDFFWTFDPNDANKYGFRFNTPMYTMNLYKPFYSKRRPKVVYVGAAKKRESQINSIKAILEDAEIATDFRIIHDQSEYIDYDEYLSIIENSSCILDITNRGQTGLTLRFMEALFLSKKLITNNVEAINQPFYNQNNIFVIGVDSISSINSFIESPYEEPDKEMVEYYDFERWIDRFAEVENV